MNFWISAFVFFSACIEELPAQHISSGWEYKCVETDRDVFRHNSGGPEALSFVGQLEKTFNLLGEENWEMVGYAMNNGVNVRYVCFKRPKPMQD